MKGQSTDDFWGSEAVLSDMTEVDYCNFVTNHRMCKGVNCNVNYGLWVILVCQCRFVSCHKCTSLVGMLIMGESVHVEAGSVMEVSTFHSILL